MVACFAIQSHHSTDIFTNPMNYFVLLVCLLIIFLVGAFFANQWSNADMENFLKFCGGGGLIFYILCCALLYHMANPSSDVYYQGLLVRKSIEYRTETYPCGDGKTCTRIVPHYYLHGKVYDDDLCKIEVSSWDYHKASEDDYFTCERDMKNFTLFNKSQYGTSQTIKERFQIAGRNDIYENYKYKRVYDNASVVQDGLELAIQNAIMQKPYDIKVLTTKETDDFYYATIDKWNGAAPDELLFFYGVNDKGEIQWARLETFAKNEKNQKLVVDFSTRHINTSYSNQLVMDDIDWVLKNYVRVSNDDSAYMQNSRSVMKENVLLIVAVIAYAIFVAMFVSSKRF